ncbi:MAG: hypothetical protein OXI20_05395 [Rhodospirillales bacterium]|nr:hypothetical protein [Rhodospirillales bacterium]
MQALGSSIVADLKRRGVRLPGFHADFVRRAFAPGIELAALSVPRGSAKTWLAGNLAALAVTPDSPLFEPGREVLGVSASLEQSRVMLQFCREALADREGDYRWLDSGQRLAVTHKASGAKLRILSSSGKRAMGLANFGTIFADEPGAWEDRGGALLWDALRTSLGKQGGQRLVLIGTRAPASADSWWPVLLETGSGPGTHIEVRSAPDDQPWDAWDTIRAVNPMVTVNASLRKTILRERDEARRNDALRPAFEAFRLNRQVDVRTEVLIAADAWRRVEARPVPDRDGRPLVGLDVGAERSWSAAWCLWRNGRVEAYALCPGVPDLAERERQDAMPAGLYRRLADDGVLMVDEGRRMGRIEVLVGRLFDAGIRPATIYCDRFLIGQLRDAVKGRAPIVERKTRWSEASSDIAAFRRLALDGPLAVAPTCRGLIRVGLASAAVRTDDQGGVRLIKRQQLRSRDDVAVAGVLACGGWERSMQRPRPRARYTGLAG